MDLTLLERLSSALYAVPIIKDYTTFSAAALTNTVTVYTIPAKTMVWILVMKTLAAFGGGALATYTITLAITGIGNVTGAVDMMAAPSDTNFNVQNGSAFVLQPYNFGSGTTITMQADSTGANLNAATQGSVEMWALVSLLA